jgi:glutamine synthetase
MTTPDEASILERAREAGVEIVHLQFTDVAGSIKSLSVPGRRLEHTLRQGAWFDGSAVEGLARVAESDLYLQPDLASFAVLPWESTPTARLMCDLSLPGGAPFPADPRQVLRAALAEAAELGFTYRVACEVEFFVFDDRSDGLARPVDRSGYFELQGRRGADLSCGIVEALAAFGVEVEATHHEVGPGQQEIDLAELDALQAADALIALKWAARAIGRQSGLLVSFMPKPMADAPGSGLHVAQTLLDRADGREVFFDPSREYALSEVGGQFLAGQLAHARGMCAVLAPLVNSYKRLAGGAEAPASVTWARVNRGALLRVPEATPARGTRLELRAPDPSCNPYLALAVMLRAGLDGIRASMPLPEPIEEAVVLDAASADLANPLPTTLGEALEELEWDPVVRDALGQPIFERFVAAKEREWQAFGQHISRWELEHYLEGA